MGNMGSMSPAPNTTSPTPLAFTPTSVLRKMTAEKEGELGIKQLALSDNLPQLKQGTFRFCEHVQIVM